MTNPNNTPPAPAPDGEVLSCEFDNGEYRLMWSDGHWLTAQPDGTVIWGRSPWTAEHPPQKASIAALAAAKPETPAHGRVKAAGWLYDQEIGNVFSSRCKTFFNEREPGEMPGVRNIRQVFTITLTLTPTTTRDAASPAPAKAAGVEGLRQAAQNALTFYDGLDRGHDEGEARILDELQAALAAAPSPKAGETR